MWNLKDPLEIYTYQHWAYATIFDKDECDKIIKYANQLGLADATIGGGNGNFNVDYSIRKSDICWLKPSEEIQWVYRKCTDFILGLNQQYFNFDLEYIENLQFTCYDGTNSFYQKHIDTLHKNTGYSIRKLSFSIQLNDSCDYDGGDLAFYYQATPNTVQKQIGLISVFPSYTLHEVTPVTRGTRYSLVGWVCGKPFR
jgi:PKHD-type hydroxylase